MKNIKAALIGFVVGFLALVLVMEWFLNVCLPVGSHEVKWQCDLVLLGMVVAFLLPGGVATMLVPSGKLVSGAVAATGLVVVAYLHPMFSGLAGDVWPLGVGHMYTILPAGGGVLLGAMLSKAFRVN